MFAVQDDWIQYESTPARRTAVRGGAACAQRLPVVRQAPARPAAPVVRVEPLRPVRSDRAPAPAVAPGRRRLRLTPRGRFVLVVLPGLLALSGGLLALSGTPAAEAASRPAAVRTVVVGSGDTLWSIAQRVEPGRDPREVVAALQRVNRLADATVPAGVVLRLPSAS